MIRSLRMVRVDAALAQRLELMEASDGAAAAETHASHRPDSFAAVEPIAGGFAIFIAPGSPLTHAIGVGMTGPVTPEDFARLLDFYRRRGSPLMLDVCPLADPTLLDCANLHRYKISEMNNVMIREIIPGETIVVESPGVTVRGTCEGEEEDFGRLIARGFLDRDELNEAERELGHTIACMPDTARLLAEIDGQPAGAGCLSVRQRLGLFYADSTLESHRGRGVHGALIGERLRLAAAAGCDLATAQTLPGSESQRHYEKLGFFTAYTKVTILVE